MIIRTPQQAADAVQIRCVASRGLVDREGEFASLCRVPLPTGRVSVREQSQFRRAAGWVLKAAIDRHPSQPLIEVNFETYPTSTYYYLDAPHARFVIRMSTHPMALGRLFWRRFDGAPTSGWDLASSQQETLLGEVLQEAIQYFQRSMPRAGLASCGVALLDVAPWAKVGESTIHRQKNQLPTILAQ